MDGPDSKWRRIGRWMCGAAAVGTILSSPAVLAQMQGADKSITPGNLYSIDSIQAIAPLALARKLRSIEQAVKSDIAAGQPSWANEGVVLTLDPENRIVIAPTAAANVGEIKIEPEVVEALRLRRVTGIPNLMNSDAIRAEAFARLARQLAGQTQSVSPSDIMGNANLPLRWQVQARAINWAGPAGNYPAKCPTARDDFFVQVESTMFTKEGQATAPMTGADRDKAITAAKNFDRECLSAVSTSDTTYPTDRLAIFSTATRVPFCTGVHLGVDRFLTARHCFIDRNSNTRREQSKGAVLNLADRPDQDFLIEEPAVVVTGPGHANDMIVVRARHLPEAVLAKTAISVAEPSPLADLAVLGYFAAADLDSLIPTSGHGSPAIWRTSLRRTQDAGKGYCRIWDWTGTTDATGCIVHTCQTMTGFSGAPLFTHTLGSWKLVGIHVAAGDKMAENNCTQFASGRTGSVMGRGGSVAARVTSGFVRLALRGTASRLADNIRHPTKEAS